jgi:hypothetical protein
MGWSSNAAKGSIELICNDLQHFQDAYSRIEWTVGSRNRTRSGL